ncbi:MAG: hypothetical protein N3B16_08090 [Candidatus Aminicenantes bacterium]|nr:hypothetical protein [Candidatus Aminicenantes bacterium]
MKMRRLSIFLIFFTILIIFPKPTSAYRPASLFLDLSYVDPGQKNWRNTWAAGFGVTFPLSSKLAFFLNFSRWRFEVSSLDVRLWGGHLTLSPLVSGIHFLLWPRKIISPLLTIGIGYFFSEYHFNQRDIITIPEIIKLNKKVKGNLSGQMGVGVVLNLFRRADFWFQIENYRTSLSVKTIIDDLNLGTFKKSESFPFRPILYRFGLQINLF